MLKEDEYSILTQMLVQGEEKQLLSAIREAIIKSPMSVDRLIPIIDIISNLFCYGTNVELLLSETLKAIKEKKEGLTMVRQINEAGLRLIKKFEGLRLDAYKCSAGVPTIGYGSTKGVEMGDKISPEEAELLLVADLEEASHQVERLITVPLNDNQFAALVSFVFNCGAGNFKASTLLRELNKGDYGFVPFQLNRWVKATVNGVKISLKGLVKRREAEGNLFISPEEIEPELSEGMPQKIDNIEEEGKDCEYKHEPKKN